MVGGYNEHTNGYAWGSHTLGITGITKLIWETNLTKGDNEGIIKIGCSAQGGMGSVDTGIVVRSPMVSGLVQVEPLFIQSAHSLYIPLTLGFPYTAINLNP